MDNFFVKRGLVILFCSIATARAHDAAALKRALVATACPMNQCLDYDRQQAEGHSFLMSTSALGHAIRLVSRLLGELYAFDQDRTVFTDEEYSLPLTEWAHWALELHTFSDVALYDVAQQLKQHPEKINYLLAELVHYRDKTSLLFERFEKTADQVHFYAQLVLFVLEAIIQKTERTIARYTSAR